MNINRESDPQFVYKYSTLKNMTNYECQAPCLCRYMDERTDFDKTMMNRFRETKSKENIEKYGLYEDRTNYDETMMKKFNRD